MKHKVSHFTALLSFVLLVQAAAQPISPFLLGQNHWLNDGDEGRVGYLHKLWPMVKKSGVKIIRIGGNGYERNFPARQKLNTIIDSIHSIGAEPLLQVPSTYSALQAMELVEYYTSSETRKVAFWSIGNEPMLHDRYTIEEVHHFILRIAKAMKDVEPDIQIFVFDEAWLKMPAYERLCGGDLDITGLKQNGTWLIDGFNFHNYPNGAEFHRDDVVFTGPKKILDQIIALTKLVDKANTKHGRTGEEALLWGLTEFNVTYANPDREISGYGNPSFLGGQFMAEVFGFGMEHSAFMINPWCISEADAVRTDFGYIGFPREFYPRSSYYHMQMMSEYLVGEYTPSNDNQDYIKTIACSDENQVSIMIMNQHPDGNFDFEINLNGKSAKSGKTLRMAIDAGISQTYKGNIPDQTTRVLVFDKSGKIIKEVTYGLELNLKNKEPQVKMN